MKLALYSLGAVLFLIPLSNAGVTQAQALPRLTPVQVQQISRDLSRSDFQDFFSVGREQLEKETQRLQTPFPVAEGLLKIDPNLKIQQDLSQFEKSQLSVPQSFAIQQ